VTELIYFDTARQALAQAATLDEVAELRTQAELMRGYYRQRKESAEMQNMCAEIKLRCERKLGELLKDIIPHQGGRPQKRSHDESVSLQDLDIDHNQSSRWQRIASVPDDEWERFIAETKAKEQELTSAGALRLAKQLKTEEQKRKIFDVEPETCVVADLEKLVADGRKFGTIYIDPPWAYGNQSTRASTDNHYQTMGIEDIGCLPIGDLAATPSHLHLWVTASFLREGLWLLEEWGFEYKTHFVWTKPQMGIGNYYRMAHEVLLLGIKGSLTFAAHDVMSWTLCDRQSHSAKPERVREMLERTSPPPRIELFARQTCPGWVSWGNEIERTLFNRDLLENVG
jgi:N6-adenosine-specific RNA methylase IME4